MKKFNKKHLQRLIESNDGPNISDMDNFENRQIGSTTAMALRTIAYAIDYPNTWVKVEDDCPNSIMSNILLFNKICEFIDKLQLNHIKCSKSRMCIMFTGVVELSDDEIDLIKQIYGKNASNVASVINKIFK